MTVGLEPAATAGTADTWTHWLSGLESAAGYLDRELASGALPDVSLDPAPAGELPPPLLERARRVLERLESVSGAIEHRRNTVGAELARLAPPRPRASSYTSWDDGSGIDVSG